MSTVSDGSNAGTQEPRDSRLRVLFFVEGFTDIRFVIGLSEICDLTMVVPERQYLESGLKGRIERAGCRIEVVTVPGGRPAFQFRSLLRLWSLAPRFDVILAQEVLRGAFNANLVGAFRKIPVVIYMGIAPLEYFRCRRERKQISLPAAMLGEAAIRSLMTFNGFFATRCLAMGPYLAQVAGGYCPRSSVGLYYGVDTDQFRPANSAERASLRDRLDLPRDSFLVLLSSRISHEKDPETVLRAVSIARAKGLDARLINLGGGFRDFLKLARDLSLPEVERWTIGREAVNPLNEVSDYFRAADAIALASLAEGAAYSTLEALACGTPVVATAVGGMAVQLDGYARLVPRRDADAMAREFLWIAGDRDAASAQALKGRDYVLREWRREKAFADLLAVLSSVSGLARQSNLENA
jgi:glycosyltransferase involved in cell wall biosynthesis